MPLPPPQPHPLTAGPAPQPRSAALALGAALAVPLFLSVPLLLAGCGGSHAGAAIDPAEPPTTLAEVGETRPGSGVMRGYLKADQYPDSLALLPAPPALGSAAALADQAAFDSTRALALGPRGALARQDANLGFPASANAFACTTGFEFDPQRTPHLATLLRRSYVDAGLSTYKAKVFYQRQRPFVVNQTGTCTPEDEPALRSDGSYPSGHTAIGWAWALVLTSLMPERTDALLARGFAFGQSRVICGAHWQSDVDNGRVVAASVVARLQADPVYQAQWRRAATEVEALSRDLPPLARDCSAEAQALALKP